VFQRTFTSPSRVFLKDFSESISGAVGSRLNGGYYKESCSEFYSKNIVIHKSPSCFEILAPSQAHLDLMQLSRSGLLTLPSRKPRPMRNAAMLWSRKVGLPAQFFFSSKLIPMLLSVRCPYLLTMIFDFFLLNLRKQFKLTFVSMRSGQ
jgi:hypothetical protein